MCVQSEDEMPISMAIKSPPNYEDSLATTSGFREAGKYSALPQSLGVGAVLGFSSDICLRGLGGSGGQWRAHRQLAPLTKSQSGCLAPVPPS